MKKYTKNDVSFHSEGYGKAHPAINVKVYHFTSRDKITEKFNCSEEQAEKALQFAFESIQSLFWENVTDIVQGIFPDAKAYSEGRSGGWLVVYGLPEIETWNAVMLAKWRKLENQIIADIKYYTCDEEVLTMIEANQWYKDGSELYNFIDTKDGKTQNIADLKQEAIKAGFGPVIKK